MCFDFWIPYLPQNIYKSITQPLKKLQEFVSLLRETDELLKSTNFTKQLKFDLRFKIWLKLIEKWVHI